ncbi:MAG: helix-turn-helix domain-containing protein [Aggregatilineales bacterium]
MARHDPAKIKMAELMLRGMDWQTAVEQAGLAVMISRSGAYWFLMQYCLRGEAVLDDQRHGHPHKLIAPIKAWLLAECQARPDMTSRELQGALWERYAERVSIGYLNQVRAAHGLSQPKKRPV